MQVLWCIPERVHSPQFKAGPVVSKGFLGDAGHAVGVGTRFPIRFLLREAGTSADIFYNHLEADAALIQESGKKLRNHA